MVNKFDHHFSNVLFTHLIGDIVRSVNYFCNLMLLSLRKVCRFSDVNFHLLCLLQRFSQKLCQLLHDFVIDNGDGLDILVELRQLGLRFLYCLRID